MKLACRMLLTATLSLAIGVTTVQAQDATPQGNVTLPM